METSTLTVKGQLLIPKRIRNKYGITSGVKVIFEETDDGVVIRPMNAGYFKSFKGIMKSTGKLKEDIQAYKEEEKRFEEGKMKRIFKGNKKTK